MRTLHLILIITIIVCCCPIWAQEVLSRGPMPSGQISGQPGMYPSTSASTQTLIPGPSSSSLKVGSSTGSSVYPQTNSIVNQQSVPGQPYQTLSGPVNGTTVPPDIDMPCLGNRLVESTWYTRVDYFHWNERSDGMDFVNEYGTLLTFGYMRRVGIERFHAAVFGATMKYKGFGQFDDGSLEPLSSATGYLGVLGEYDLHYEPDRWPTLSLFAGLGTRLWIRDIKDGITDFGNVTSGYQETWWTFYPYLGIENKRTLQSGIEFYGSARIGCTAFTYQYATWGDVALYPKVGLTGQAELGLRGPHAFISIYTETMAWGESDVVRDWRQPNSEFITLGMKAGFSF
jgi:hypothetical protein